MLCQFTIRGCEMCWYDTELNLWMHMNFPQWRHSWMSLCAGLDLLLPLLKQQSLIISLARGERAETSGEEEEEKENEWPICVFVGIKSFGSTPAPPFTPPDCHLLPLDWVLLTGIRPVCTPMLGLIACVYKKSFSSAFHYFLIRSVHFLFSSLL